MYFFLNMFIILQILINQIYIDFILYNKTIWYIVLLFFNKNINFY